MVDISPETYKQYVGLEGGNTALYVIVLKAIYVILKASMMWY